MFDQEKPVKPSLWKIEKEAKSRLIREIERDEKIPKKKKKKKNNGEKIQVFEIKSVENYRIKKHLWILFILVDLCVLVMVLILTWTNFVPVLGFDES